ncbi:MAG: hypothetical protein ACLUR5_16715 [Eubacterium ventriosum]
MNREKEEESDREMKMRKLQYTDMSQKKHLMHTHGRLWKTSRGL